MLQWQLQLPSNRPISLFCAHLMIIPWCGYGFYVHMSRNMVGCLVFPPVVPCHWHWHWYWYWFGLYPIPGFQTLTYVLVLLCGLHYWLQVALLYLVEDIKMCSPDDSSGVYCVWIGWYCLLYIAASWNWIYFWDLSLVESWWVELCGGSRMVMETRDKLVPMWLFLLPLRHHTSIILLLLWLRVDI